MGDGEARASVSFRGKFRSGFCNVGKVGLGTGNKGLRNWHLGSVLTHQTYRSDMS
jgi:hypothetical protein